MPTPKSAKTKAKPAAAADDDLLAVLQERFAQNPGRHPGVSWEQVKARLAAASPAKIRSLEAMEKTGGEPDVVGLDKKTGEIVFMDCAPQSPVGRHSLCYDREALNARKEHKPKNSALDLASEMGVEILGEEQYFALQKLGEFDTKTSSWIATPADIRYLGGALFCDRRYNRVFTGHNGAQSYYSGRGFRASLKI